MNNLLKGLAVVAFLLPAVSLSAQENQAGTETQASTENQTGTDNQTLAATDHQNPWKHQVSLGLGDPIAETLFYRATPHKDYTPLRPEVTYYENQDYHYLPHIFADYYYSFKDWLHVGCQVDFGCFYWNKVYYQGGSNDAVKSDRQVSCNICILPEVRFDWFRRTHFRLFSAVRVGIDINTGSEQDYLKRYTAVGVALEPTLIGCSYGWEHWFVAAELGTLNALCSTAEIFLANSKNFSISGGYRF